MPDITDIADFYAEVFNQYRRRIGAGVGLTREQAIGSAIQAADRELRTANPRWKWRKAKTQVIPNPFKRA